jgi:hypothetical protein
MLSLIMLSFGLCDKIDQLRIKSNYIFHEADLGTGKCDQFDPVPK